MTALAAVGVLVAAQGSAFASAVKCGAVITEDTTLNADLTGCPGTGLSIGADNITLNLDGHTVSSTANDGSAGIENNGHRGVVIQNGTILGFAPGIFLNGAINDRLRGLTLSDNSGLGILLIGSSHNHLDNNVVSHRSSGGQGDGIVLFQSDHNELARNSLLQNGDGISLVQAKGNDVEGNSSSSSGAGISLVDSSSRNVIENNRVLDNSDTGVLLDRHADGNLIDENRASGNRFAGIAVGASDGNRVLGNRTTRNGGAGIAIVDNAIGTVVQGNRANHNGGNPPDCVPQCPELDDGIYVDAPATTLTKNITNENQDFGIDAVPGVIDGGDNRAKGNGNPSQCTGVFCRP